MAVAGPSEPRTEREGQGVSGASARGSHRLVAAKRCGRLHWLRYILGLVPQEHDPDMLTGTLAHTYLAYHYGAKLPNKPAWFNEQTLDDALVRDAGAQQFLIERGVLAAQAFLRNEAASAWEPVAVEQEYAARLADLVAPYTCPPDLADEVITCRVDLVAYRGGRLYAPDHKSQAPDNRKKPARLYPWKELNEWSTSLQTFQNLRILRAQEAGVLPSYVHGIFINRFTRDPPYDSDSNLLTVRGPAYKDSALQILEAVRLDKQLVEAAARGVEPTPSFDYSCKRCDYYDVCFAESDEARAMILTLKYRRKDGSPALPIVQ